MKTCYFNESNRNTFTKTDIIFMAWVIRDEKSVGVNIQHDTADQRLSRKFKTIELCRNHSATTKQLCCVFVNICSL